MEVILVHVEAQNLNLKKTPKGDQMNELTMQDIEQAMKLVKEENTCDKCGTERNLMVLGICELDHIPLFCKCQADKLCDTPYVKNQAKLIKEFASGRKRE